MTDRVAAIDCGTNSIRLLIADIDKGLDTDGADVRVHDVHREMRIVRLGQGVDATGKFAPEAIARTRDALADYADLLRQFGVDRVRMVATSATRDAANRDEFFDMTADVLGAVVPGAVAEVITGAEEAELSFIGAVAELDTAAAPFVVIDLGGGSTEVVVGSRHADTGYSADIGCVRITERCLHSDPPTAGEIEAGRAMVRTRLGAALRAVPVEGARTWVGVAGTFTTLAALAQRMTTYDSDAIHLSRVRPWIERWRELALLQFGAAGRVGHVGIGHEPVLLKQFGQAIQIHPALAEHAHRAAVLVDVGLAVDAHPAGIPDKLHQVLRPERRGLAYCTPPASGCSSRFSRLPASRSDGGSGTHSSSGGAIRSLNQIACASVHVSTPLRTALRIVDFVLDGFLIDRSGRHIAALRFL